MVVLTTVLRYRVHCDFFQLHASAICMLSGRLNISRNASRYDGQFGSDHLASTKTGVDIKLFIDLHARLLVKAE